MKRILALAPCLLQHPDACLDGMPERCRASRRRATRFRSPSRARRACRAATSDVAVLAGGCFWGVQGVFQGTSMGHQRGLRLRRRRPEVAIYEVVSSGTTGHAESVQITLTPD